MKNRLFKDFIREVKCTKSRFISIVLIVALGVGFFIGVKAASPSMKYSANKFFEMNNFMDFRIISEFGLKDDDIKAISQVQGVSQVMASYSTDLLVNSKGKNSVVRVHGLPRYVESNEKPINEVNVVEGRLPNKSGECVVESHQKFEGSYKIGDKVTFNSPEEGKNIKDIVKEESFTVVGLIESPQYISFDRGISQVGDGTVLYYMMILPQDFAYPRYTECYVKVNKNYEEASTFSDEYKEVISRIREKLQGLEKARIEVNRNEIMEEANKQLNEGKDKLNKETQELNNKISKGNEDLDNGKKEIATKETELAQGEKKLIQGRKDIDKSKAEISQREVELQEGRKKYNEEIAEGERKLEQGKKDYEEGLEKYNKEYADFQVKKEESQKKIDKGKEDLEKLRQEIVALQVLYDNLSAFLDKEDPSLVQLKSTIDEKKEQYKKGQGEIAAAEKQLADAEHEFQVAKSNLDNAKKQLDESEAKLQSEKVEGQRKLDDGQAQINNGKEEIVKAEAQYNKSKLELEQGKQKLDQSKGNIAEAEKNLNKAKEDATLQLEMARDEMNKKEEEIKKVSLGKWYIFDREGTPGYKSFLDDAARINAIASIFPLFFFIVAALVCLTTMTRMVEEQRTQIGTLKALGYSNKDIASKYFFYAFAAAIIGSAIGIAWGLALLPKLIFNAYSAMYRLPHFYVTSSWLIILLSILGALLCTCTVAIIVTYKELKSNPAVLMRPKAPRIGKRIFLEKIPFIWDKMNFTAKVTARNLLRYKVRFFMTVLGVAGCTALILASYGLKDAISVVVPKQYGEIFDFDTIMSLKYEGNLKEKELLKKALNNDTRFKDSMLTRQSNIKVTNNRDDNPLEVKLFVPEKVEMLPQYVKIRTRLDGKSLTFNRDSVIITEKLGTLLNVGIGDFIKLSEDNTEFQLKVTDITENYVFNYVYISPELYQSKVGREAKFNTVVSKLTEEGKSQEESIAEDWLKKSDVMVINFTSYVIKSFEDMIKSLNTVVLVMIVCAAALAFVVLYNLTNINVAERTREIATIKVLGFSNSESANYVYRENTVLSILGIILGIVMGIFLSYFVVSTVEMDIVMFGRRIKNISYIYAIAFTFIFTLMVNLFMYKRLSNISMVESLKSIE